jgi:hypothetical protein
MKMTIDQVKADIEGGTSTRIYYDTQSAWWTHLDRDLEEATKQGEAASKALIKKKLADPNTPKSQRAFLESFAKKYSGKNTVPLSPQGSVLFEAPAADWFAAALSKPNQYGRNQLNALMMSHHQNCGDLFSVDWHDYNILFEAQQ